MSAFDRIGRDELFQRQSERLHQLVRAIADRNAFYTRKFADGVRRRSPLFSLHALRVLVSGAIFHVTGRQPAGGLLLRESFMTEHLLRKELDRLGLGIDGELSDSNPFTPSYRVVKRSGPA